MAKHTHNLKNEQKTHTHSKKIKNKGEGSPEKDGQVRKNLWIVSEVLLLVIL